VKVRAGQGAKHLTICHRHLSARDQTINYFGQISAAIKSPLPQENTRNFIELANETANKIEYLI